MITAGRRLARVLASEFHTLQAERGQNIWNRPDILPFDAFIERAWSEWLGRSADASAPQLLDAVQEQSLWERIIRASPEGASLLQIPETARQAMETWRLIAEYRLPVDGSYEACGDWSAFADWSREFERQCEANGWLDRARLADFLRGKMGAQGIDRPGVVYAAGFDEMTPRQADFFAALGNWRALETPGYAPALVRRKLRDSTAEMRRAAAWARGLLEKDPETQIGIIVVPDLTRSRAKIERILTHILDPGGGPGGRRRPFHLSVGPALIEYPLIHAALLMLEFAVGQLPLPRAGMLLRSPFLGGAEKEWSKRAQWDAKLRKRGVWDVSVPRLLEEAGNCPELERRLRRVQKHLRSIPPEQLPSRWTRDLEDLLEAYGWPGSRVPTSTEFQIIARWRELLSSFAALDLTVPAMNLAQAIDWLHRQAADIRFQVEDEGAPVQVMGMLEAAGLHFDHLWIMGLDDEALPARANPNPFLPISLQRQRRLPHSSAERELEFAAKAIAQLLAGAPDVVLSYPETEGDRALMPSPLVAGAWIEDDGGSEADWIASMRAMAVFEEIADEAGPALAHSDSTGGASLFKDMAACPFRAFAKYRLGARPLEEADLGLSYRDRGTTVHKALEVIWRELGSQARLLELSQAELNTLITRGADAAIAKLGPGIGRDLERQRLQRLLSQWLEIEKSRPAFSVAAIEAERSVSMAGLDLCVRADRVDALPDGRQIILDYKTGQLKARGWEGERPDEPQLPLYCATSENSVAGAAFAMIRTGELRFRGLTSGGVTLPALQKMAITPALPFSEQVEEWRSALEDLAAEFRAGHAQLDPKPDACDNCGLRALCRIREIERDRG